MNIHEIKNNEEYLKQYKSQDKIKIECLFCQKEYLVTKYCIVRTHPGFCSRQCKNDFHLKENNGKYCSMCKELKQIQMFNKSKTKKDGHCSHCKECNNKRYKRKAAYFIELQKDYYENNKELCRDKQKKYYENNKSKAASYKQTLTGKYNTYKNSAKQRNLNFLLTKEEFQKLISENCNYCNAPLAGGIDRTDNRIGYTVDNCVSCCTVCNKMKLNLSQESFLTHCKKITEHNFGPELESNG